MLTLSEGGPARWYNVLFSISGGADWSLGVVQSGASRERGVVDGGVGVRRLVREQKREYSRGRL